MTKLLRTIRLDASDGFVFERAAAPGEWAVSGAFAFWDGDPAALHGKARVAFRSGFLGVASLGWSTLVEIVEASDAEHAALVDRLAHQLVARFGAPDLARAEPAAREEVGFAQSLCEHEPGTLIAVHRQLADDGVREAFRTLRARDRSDRSVFSFLEAPDETGPGETGPEDGVDLVALGRRP
jgi:hypothetical protein